MAKRRTYRRYTRAAKRRVRRYYGKARRRVGSAKIPLEVAIAGVAIPFTEPKAGWSSPAVAVAGHDWKGLMDSLKLGFIGMDENGNVDLFGAINPFDMEHARYTKMLMAAGLVHKVRTKIVKIPMKKIPFVGRYIS